MSAIFSDPPFFGGLVNSSIKANKFTSLNLGQGSSPAPPSELPGNLPLLEVVEIGTGSIALTFSSLAITGTRPIIYECHFGIAGTGLTQRSEVFEDSPEIWGIEIKGLQSETDYEVQLVAANSVGQTTGEIQGFSTDAQVREPPSQAPGAPVLVDAGGTSLFVSSDTTGIEGTQPITYGFEYGLTTALGSSADGTESTTTPFLQICTIDPDMDLLRDTDYYVACRAGNNVGTVLSAISGPFRTLA